MKSIINLSLTALLLTLTSTNSYSAETVIVDGFDMGCNPCKGKTPNGKTFVLSFKLTKSNYVEQITLDGKTFKIDGGEAIYSDSFPPLNKIEFQGNSKAGPKAQIYAVKAPSGAYNTNYHYFNFDGNSKNNWHYLGQYPSLSFDTKNKTYYSSMRTGPNVDEQYYRLKGNKLVLIDKPTNKP